MRFCIGHTNFLVTKLSSAYIQATGRLTMRLYKELKATLLLHGIFRVSDSPIFPINLADFFSYFIDYHGPLLLHS